MASAQSAIVDAERRPRPATRATWPANPRLPICDFAHPAQLTGLVTDAVDGLRYRVAEQEGAQGRTVLWPTRREDASSGTADRCRHRHPAGRQRKAEAGRAGAASVSALWACKPRHGTVHPAWRWRIGQGRRGRRGTGIEEVGHKPVQAAEKAGPREYLFASRPQPIRHGPWLGKLCGRLVF